MPKLIHALPKYSLHRPSGQAKVRHNGRTIYLGKFGTPESKAAYARFIANLPKQEAVAIFTATPRPATEEGEPRTPLLVGEIVLRFFNHAREYYVRDGADWRARDHPVLPALPDE